MQELESWLENVAGAAGASMAPASGDASFRRYFRLQCADESFIVMDAPPPQEDCRPFVQIAEWLHAMGLNAPRVLAADIDRGFLLLTDLGSRQYLDVLNSRPEDAERLYDDAIRALARMQVEGARFQGKLPAYDAALLQTELSLFRDWLCGQHLDLDFDAADQKAWAATCDVLIENALGQKQVFVHRDYHSRNLMRTEHHNPGILDFQDAVAGPLTYDLVSLLKDCYVRWPDEFIMKMCLRFHAEIGAAHGGGGDRESFVRQFDLMGVQRQLKAAGIFARLLHRDGKSGYLADVPRTLRYISAIAPRYPELKFVSDLIDERVLPALLDDAP